MKKETVKMNEDDKKTKAKPRGESGRENVKC
jgi:hypothetical protein